MVNVRENLTGRTFGRLTVIAQAEDHIQPNGVHRPVWKCQCSCADKNIVFVQGADLKCGKTTSCGCVNREKVKKYNDVILDLTDEHGMYGIGVCNNTGSKFYFDMDDYDKIKNYCWNECVHNGYHYLSAWNLGIGGNIIMSHLLGYKYYDHEDRNPLNNRRYNFRKATNSQNSSNRKLMKNNTSGVTGVSLDKKTNKWMARIQVENKRIIIGKYIDKDDAIRARLRAEKKYFGEFAPQRHLYKEYKIL